MWCSRCPTGYLLPWAQSLDLRSPPGKMTVLPTINQFPPFADTLLWLTNRACRCIWYLPDKERCCFIGITDEVNQSALHLAKEILKAGAPTNRALQVLADIAQQSCCARHHRNKMWGSGLAQELAIRWQNEIQVALSAQTFKLESVSPSISECSSKLGDHSVNFISNGHSDSKSLPTDQAVLTTRSLFPTRLLRLQSTRFGKEKHCSQSCRHLSILKRAESDLCISSLTQKMPSVEWLK